MGGDNTNKKRPVGKGNWIGNKVIREREREKERDRDNKWKSKIEKRR